MTVDWFALHHQSNVTEFFLVQDVQKVSLFIWLLLLELKLTIHQAVHVTARLHHILILALPIVGVVVYIGNGSLLVLIHRYSNQLGTIHFCGVCCGSCG